MGSQLSEGFWDGAKNEAGSVRQWTRRCLEAKLTWLVVKAKGKECWVMGWRGGGQGKVGH